MYHIWVDHGAECVAEVQIGFGEDGNQIIMKKFQGPTSMVCVRLKILFLRIPVMLGRVYL
jgi:hypothetical protein